MKIVEAKVEPTEGKFDLDTRYSACVTVLSNGERITQAARGRTPHEAVLSAVSHCAHEFTDRMKKSVRIGMEVAF